MNTIDRIFDLMREKNIPAYNLSLSIGLNKNAVSDWKLGKAKPSADALSKIADFFNVSVDYLLGRTDTPHLHDSNGIPCPEPTTEHSHWVPVYGSIAAGIPIDAIEDIEDFEEVDDKLGEVFCLRVKGHSMEPRICDGDVVVIHKQENIENGEIAAVMVNGDEATLKKVKIDKNGIMLIPLNPTFETMYYSRREIEEKPVRILGKMIELRGKF